MAMTVTEALARVDAARHTRDFAGELRVERSVEHGLVDAVTAPLAARTRATMAENVLSAVPEGLRDQFVAALVRLGGDWRVLYDAQDPAKRTAYGAVYALASEAAAVQMRGLRAVFGGAR